MNTKHAITRRLTPLALACHARMGRPLSSEALDEAIQEAALAAWGRRSTFREESSVETWLYGIARICIQREIVRRRRTSHARLSAIEFDHAATGTRPGSRFGTDLQRAVQRGLISEGTTAAAIVRARDVEGLTFAKIGSQMGMSESAVKQRYHRKLPAIRERLRRCWIDLRR